MVNGCLAVREMNGRANVAMTRFLPILCFFLFTTVHAEPGEKFFKQALGYTVKVKTTVKLPFGEDIKGVWGGAGFLVDARSGWIMTNAHVAGRSPAELKVAFHDGGYLEARQVYIDPYLDLAILEVQGENKLEAIKAASLDCGDPPAVGHPVGAFGHPWSLSYTGTRGIISGVTSKIEAEMLQTDAPVNPGNSGGPLISLRTGKVVGIATSRIDDDDDQGTNFAVPMKHACRVLRLLQKGSDPSPPELPVTFFLDVDDGKTLTVAKSYLDPDLLPLQSGDVIREVIGVSAKIENEAQLVHALRGRLANVQLKVIRAGKEIVVSGRLRAASRVTERRGVYVSGILFAPFQYRDSGELRRSLTLRVHHIERGSIASGLEIEEFDFLQSVNGKDIEDLDGLYESLASAQQNEKPVVVVLKRWHVGSGIMFEYVERELVISDLKFIGARKQRHIAKGE